MHLKKFCDFIQDSTFANDINGTKLRSILQKVAMIFLLILNQLFLGLLTKPRFGLST